MTVPVQIPTAPLPACMGGWCTRRDQCARYHQEAHRLIPAERLCQPGVRDVFRPIDVVPQAPRPQTPL